VPRFEGSSNKEHILDALSSLLVRDTEVVALMGRNCIEKLQVTILEESERNEDPLPLNISDDAIPCTVVANPDAKDDRDKIKKIDDMAQVIEPGKSQWKLEAGNLSGSELEELEWDTWFKKYVQRSILLQFVSDPCYQVRTQRPYRHSGRFHYGLSICI
jgi:hypothetical protein